MVETIVTYEHCPVCTKPLEEWFRTPKEHFSRDCRDLSFAHFTERLKIFPNGPSVQTIWIETEDYEGSIDRLEIEYRQHSRVTGEPKMTIFYNGHSNYDFHYVVKDFIDIETTMHNIERLSHLK